MNDRQRRAYARARADQAVIRDAARLPRDPAVRGRWVGLSDPYVAERLADLLERFAEGLPAADAEIRHVTVTACQTITGSPMDRPRPQYGRLTTSER